MCACVCARTERRAQFTGMNTYDEKDNSMEVDYVGKD